MTHDLHPPETPGQTASLSELLSRYLQRQAALQQAGLAAPDASGEVLPFDAAPAPTTDAGLAWKEAVQAGVCFVADAATWTPPPEWPALVAAQEPAFALAFCLGNFPQMVRHLQPLLKATDLTNVQPTAPRPHAVPELLPWTKRMVQEQRYPDMLLGLGALRLARQFAAARELFQAHRTAVPETWRPLWANEEAALAWHQGKRDEAETLWQGQAASGPILYNRGMAALFGGRPEAARRALQQASAQIDVTSAWHHLAQLYLTLAERSA